MAPLSYFWISKDDVTPGQCESIVMKAAVRKYYCPSALVATSEYKPKRNKRLSTVTRDSVKLLKAIRPDGHDENVPKSESAMKKLSVQDYTEPKPL